MPRLLHPCDERFSFRKNYRLARVRAGEFFHRIHGVEAEKRKELDFVIILTEEQLPAAVSINLARRDAREISSRSISSYAFASARFVHPCQIRAITGQCFSCSCS
jgi:hypothetical protein